MGRCRAQQACSFAGQQGNVFMAVNLSRVRALYTVSGDGSGSGLVYAIALKIRLFLSSRKILLRTVALWFLICRCRSGRPLLPGMVLVAIRTISPVILHALPRR